MGIRCPRVPIRSFLPSPGPEGGSACASPEAVVRQVGPRSTRSDRWSRRLLLGALPVIGLIGFLVLAPASAAAAGTSIVTSGHIGGGFPFYSANTPDGPTTITTEHHLELDPTIVSPGSLDGQGVADYGELKVRLSVKGPSAQTGTCTASANDTWTINHPTLNGTEGVLQLAFRLEGLVTVLDLLNAPLTGDDRFASVQLNVSIDGESVLALDRSLGTGPVFYPAETGSPTVTAPHSFIYGAPFQVGMVLKTIADPDNAYLRTDFNPFFTHYGGGTVSEITLDFGNTAKLAVIAISNADGATQVVADSLTDYQALVSAEVPPDSRPRLTIIRQADGTVRIGWAEVASGWVLEQTDALGSFPGSWTEVPEGEIQSDADERFHVIERPEVREFFRLKQMPP